MRDTQAGLLRQLQQQLQRLVGHAVLGVIEVNADGFGGQALAALGSSAKSFRRCNSRIFG